MNITINGKQEIVHCETLDELLDELGHRTSRVATAVNQEFVPVDQRAQHKLVEGDSIDIIAPMAGG
jgi:sulfur carrier protein